jgi:hypothetical protein
VFQAPYKNPPGLHKITGKPRNSVSFNVNEVTVKKVSKGFDHLPGTQQLNHRFRVDFLFRIGGSNHVRWSVSDLSR